MASSQNSNNLHSAGHDRQQRSSAPRNGTPYVYPSFNVNNDGAPASTSQGPVSPHRPPPAVAPGYVSPGSSTAAPPPPSRLPLPPQAHCSAVVQSVPIIRIHTASTTSSSSSFEDRVASPRTRAMVREASVLADAAYAKKMQQELQDEEVARRMQQKEEERSNRNSLSGHVQEEQPRAQDNRGGCRLMCARINRCISCIIFLAVATVLGIVAYVFLGGNSFTIPGTDIDVGALGESIGDVFMEDNWGHGPEGSTSTNSSVPQTFWRTSGNDGLELTLLNALSSDWHTHFDAAVQDWDNGTPDALTLKTRVVTPDPTCEPVSGAMKVCNAAYGLNGWKGINEVLVTSRGYITVSVAKMNESYLNGINTNTFGQSSSDDERRYTMCHEIGHGFGLNHADENFNNRDLGTCMDYTNRPQNNLTPNDQNYETLATLYGLVPGSSTSSSSNTNISAQQLRTNQGGSSGSSQTAKQASTGGKKGDHDRMLDTTNDAFNLRGKPQSNKSTEEHAHPKFTSFANETDENRRSLWRVLDIQPGKELHIRELEGGYKVVAQVLLANDYYDELQ